MALTVTRLSSDSSFLLSLEPIPFSPLEEFRQDFQPFRILLDPCIIEHTAAPTISIVDLPEPDLVVISSHKDDHCNEETLRKLPRSGTELMILGDETTTRRIKSWKYFDPSMVKTMSPWMNPFTCKHKAKDNILRFKIPSPVIGGSPGEVTITLITQKKDCAIGITYTPQIAHVRGPQRPPTSPLSPITPITPMSSFPLTRSHNFESSRRPSTSRSFNSLPSSSRHYSKSLRSSRSAANLSPSNYNRGVSLIFSPHGIPYEAIGPYATTHLLSQAVLPLTTLLHCFDTVSYPWWRPGDASIGMAAARETASILGAKVCISAHDGNKASRNFLGKLKSPKRVRCGIKKAQEMIDELGSRFTAPKPANMGTRFTSRVFKAMRTTEVLALEDGEQVTMTSEGIWEIEEEEEWSDSDDIAPLPSPPFAMYSTPDSSFEWLPGPC